MTTRQLTAVLTRTLEVKAEQAMTSGASPSRQVAATPGYTEPQQPAERRSRLLPAAAVLAVLALGTVAAIALRSGLAEEQVGTAPLGDPPGRSVPAP